MPHERRKDKSLARRDALKALVAATGALALASLPKEWETPAVEVGALPAHAQVSCGLAISNVDVSREDGDLFYTVSFDYDDALGDVGLDTLVRFEVTSQPAGITQSSEDPISDFVLGIVGGDGSTGTITVSLPVYTGSGGTSADVVVSIRTSNGCRSNELSFTITFPS